MSKYFFCFLLFLSTRCISNRDNDIFELNSDNLYFNFKQIEELKPDDIGDYFLKTRVSYNSEVNDSIIFRVSEYANKGIVIENQLFINSNGDSLVMGNGAFSIGFHFRGTKINSAFTDRFILFGKELNLDDDLSKDSIKEAIPGYVQIKERELFNSLSFILKDYYITFFFVKEVDGEKLNGLIARKYVTHASHN